MGPTSEPYATARESLMDDDARREGQLPFVCYGISAEVEDQSIFDDDGWLATPLLEPSRDSAYIGYRYAYAEMLQMWGQPLARLEIMKFNVLKQDPLGAALESFGNWSAKGDAYHDSYHSADSISHASQSHQGGGGGANIVLGKKEQLQAVISSGRGLDVTGLCRVHETHLEPMQTTHPSARSGGAAGTCERCHRAQTQLACVYCREPIDSLYVPCLTCGCAAHDACLAEWYAATSEAGEDVELECPAGDECHCVDHACEGQIESFAVMMGALRQGKVRKPSTAGGGGGGSGSAKPGHAHGYSNSTGGRFLFYVDDENSRDRNGWERVDRPSTADDDDDDDDDGKPLARSQSQIPMPSTAAAAAAAAARFNFGSRLRKSAGQWGSTASLRRKPAGASALSR